MEFIFGIHWDALLTYLFRGKRERVITKILILVQVTIMAFQTAIIAKVLQVGFTKGDDSLDVKYW